jgi:hypothetical protein
MSTYNSKLATLPTLPRLPKKAKELRRCECGCPGLTQSRFVPGHDARLHGWKLRVQRGLLVEGGDTTAQLDWIADNASVGEAIAVGRAVGFDYREILETRAAEADAEAEGMVQAG